MLHELSEGLRRAGHCSLAFAGSKAGGNEVTSSPSGMVSLKYLGNI